MRLAGLCWALWVLALAGPAEALTGDQVLGSLLRQLGLRRAPVLHRADVEGLAVPVHVRAEYVALLQRSRGDRSRGKRFSQSFRPLLLQVSVQRELLGAGAGAGAHRLVRFAAQGARARAEPQLELHTLDLQDYGAQGACDLTAVEPGGARCCRRETFLDLQGAQWAENWVLEPPGLLVYECVGSCLQPPEPLSFKWPFLGPRQCIASETAALPMIISVKEGGRTRSRVVSLPNMRVQKCSCAWEGAPVPRVLEP
uniref:Left-right determination factor 1-like n=1 Tax=Chinchilla lanigera TaxID=34839 RepID=A0A8C2UWN4_CHILA